MPHIHEKIDFIVNAFIVHKKKVIFVLHRQLKLWLPPGGHIELDEDPIVAVYREAAEESGIVQSALTLVDPYDSQVDVSEEGYTSFPTPAFLDIHKISSTHQHIGMNYIFTSTTDQVSLSERESEDIRWFSASEIEDPQLAMPKNIRTYALKAIESAEN